MSPIDMTRAVAKTLNTRNFDGTALKHRLDIGFYSSYILTGFMSCQNLGQMYVLFLFCFVHTRSSDRPI